MHPSPTHRRRFLMPVAGLVAATTLLGACNGVEQQAAAVASHGDRPHTSVSQPAKNQSAAALRSAMQRLWADHMQWTYATVDAFFHNQAALQPTLDRLLRNQRDLCDAIKPYFGEAAGDALGDLLTTHIEDAVPVLTAAQANDEAALNSALAAWQANAKDIAHFLTKANPRQWPASATEPMMKAHIDQTVAYAVDLLKGDYPAAIAHFEVANDHMVMMADTLSKGIVARFPKQFRR